MAVTVSCMSDNTTGTISKMCFLLGYFCHCSFFFGQRSQISDAVAFLLLAIFAGKTC